MEEGDDGDGGRRWDEEVEEVASLAATASASSLLAHQWPLPPLPTESHPISQSVRLPWSAHCHSLSQSASHCTTLSST